MPKAKTMKSKKVQKATGVSDKKTLEYLLRLIENKVKSDEFPAQVVKVLGGGRFLVKNMLNKEEESVHLSSSLVVSKHAAQDKHVRVAVGVNHIVLVEHGTITARITSEMWPVIKSKLELPGSASNNGYIFAVGGTTRKNKNRK